MTTKKKPPAPATDTPIYDALVAELGTPNLTPAPDLEAVRALAVAT